MMFLRVNFQFSEVLYATPTGCAYLFNHGYCYAF